MKRYKAVIFDLDGTLLDTLEDLHAAVNYTMSLFGYPSRSLDEVRRFVGNGVERLIELSLPGGADDPHRDEAVREYRRYYNAHSSVHTKPYEGIVPLLEKLKSRGIPTAVASNKPHAATVGLCRDMFPSVEVACGEREAEGIRRKPSPDMVIWAARQMGFSPEECVYVGDSEVDVITAGNAGMDCITVLWGFRDREELEKAGATVFCRSAEELERLISNS